MAGKLHSSRYQIFLDEFRRLREDAGLSQAELAQKLKVRQPIISQSESGHRRVDVAELQLWAEACGSTLTAFALRLTRRVARNKEPDA